MACVSIGFCLLQFRQHIILRALLHKLVKNSWTQQQQLSVNTRVTIWRYEKNKTRIFFPRAQIERVRCIRSIYCICDLQRRCERTLFKVKRQKNLREFEMWRHLWYGKLITMSSKWLLRVLHKILKSRLRVAITCHQSWILLWNV